MDNLMANFDIPDGHGNSPPLMSSHRDWPYEPLR